jgi:DNA-binding protein HU-beta
MNKSDLIERVASEMESTKTNAAKAVEAVIAAIAAGVARERKVTIAGFGSFIRRARPGRTGVNPVTKQRIRIKPSVTCAFRPAPALKDRL